MATTSDQLALPTWQQIHGSDNWDGLLSPFHINLRREIIRYGEFVMAVSDGINNVEESKLRFYPFYGKSVLFSAVGAQHIADTYAITRYLYATTENEDGTFSGGKATTTTSLWMGIIAVSSDEETTRLGRRDVVIAFRGAMSDADLSHDLQAELVPFPDLGGSTAGAPSVHKGFLALYDTAPASDKESQTIATDSLRQQVVKELRSLLGKYSSETVSVTVVGHSQGGALASLCAYDIASNGVAINGSSSAQLAAFTYASPRVGGRDFRRKCDEVLGLKVLRVVDSRDLVPHLPPWLPFLYEHQGVEFLIDGSQSTYVKPINGLAELGMAHDMEGYLHTVAGIAGPLPETRNAGGHTNAAAIDKLVAPHIGGNVTEQSVYDSLKKKFAGNLKGLLELVQKVVNKKTPAMTTEQDAAADDDDFWLRVERDFALVNKRADLLKDEYGIHKNWWVLRNKGTVQMIQTNGERIWRPAHFDLLSNLAADPDFI